MPALFTRASSPSHSDSDEPEVYHEALDPVNLQVTTSRGRTPTKKIWVTLGKKGARQAQMYGAVYDATIAYIAVYNAEEDPVMNNDIDGEVQDRNDEFVRWLMAESPLFKTLVETGNTATLEAVCKLIEEGRTEARNDDAKTLKGFVTDDAFGMDLVPPLKDKKTKSDRGFYHPQLGHMLCPCSLDWENEEVQMNFRTAGAVVPHKIFPMMVYRNLEYDSEDIEKGLFENEQIIRCFYRIVILTQREKMTTLEEKIKRGLTPYSLAYVVVLERLAISSDQRIDSGTFKYGEFYSLLVKTLKRDEGFWRRLCRVYIREIGRIFDGDDDDNVEDSLAKLDSQRLKKKKQAEKAKQPLKAPQKQNPKAPHLAAASTPASRTNDHSTENVQPQSNASGSGTTQSAKRSAEEPASSEGPKRARVLHDSTNTNKQKAAVVPPAGSVAANRPRRNRNS